MTSVEELRNELAQSADKATEVIRLMNEVITKIDEMRIRMGNAMTGAGDKELQGLLNQWADLALKDAKEVAEIMPSITAKLGEYMSRF